MTAERAAAQGNYRAVPSGGRSALMGNTGVAMSRDGSAPFLNPATTVGITDTRLALSANFYAVTTTTLDSFHAPRTGGRRLGDTSVHGVPSTFCFFLTLGRIAPEAESAERKLALCAGTSEERDLSVADAQSVDQSLHVAALERRWGRVHVGPTYARTIGDRVAVGASLHVVNANMTSLTTASQNGASGSSTLTSSTNGSSFDVALLLGATYRVDKATTVGLSFLPPSVHLGGTLDATDHAQSGATSRTRSATSSFSAPLPMRVAAGIGTRTKRLRVEADATYFFPLADAFRSEVDVRTLAGSSRGVSDSARSLDVSTRANGVIDSAVGAEWFVGETISLLGGLATDFGATPRLSADPPLGTAVHAREQRAIMSLGIGSYGSGTELLFGAQLAYARGQTLVADTSEVPGALTPVDRHTTTVLFVIAGSTSLKALRRTLDDLRQTLPKVP